MIRKTNHVADRLLKKVSCSNILKRFSTTFQKKNFAKPSQRGFTLVELIVVIVIVGILSALATTSYKKTISMAEISVAKVHLYNYYASQKFYFSEVGSYHHEKTDTTPDHFDIIGFNPEGKLLFRIGAHLSNGYYSTEHYCKLPNKNCPEDLSLASVALNNPHQPRVTSTTFTGIAKRKLNNTTLTIDQNKTIVQIP